MPSWLVILFRWKRENPKNVSKLHNSCLFVIIQKRKIFLLKMLQGHCLVLAALYSTNFEWCICPLSRTFCEVTEYFTCNVLTCIKSENEKNGRGVHFCAKLPVCVDTETGSNSISITPIVFMNECNTFIFRDTSCYCLKKAGKRCRVLKDPNIHLGHLSSVEYQSKKSRICYNIYFETHAAQLPTL